MIVVVVVIYVIGVIGVIGTVMIVVIDSVMSVKLTPAIATVYIACRSTERVRVRFERLADAHDERRVLFGRSLVSLRFRHSRHCRDFSTAIYKPDRKSCNMHDEFTWQRDVRRVGSQAVARVVCKTTNTKGVGCESACEWRACEYGQ